MRNRVAHLPRNEPKSIINYHSCNNQFWRWYYERFAELSCSKHPRFAELSCSKHHISVWRWLEVRWVVGPHRCWSTKNSPCISTSVSVGTITKNSKRDIVRSQFLQWRELGLVLVIIGLGRWSIPLTKWKKEEEEEIGYCWTWFYSCSFKWFYCWTC